MKNTKLERRVTLGGNNKHGCGKRCSRKKKESQNQPKQIRFCGD